MNEFSIVDFAKDTWPVSTIFLILVTSGFLKVSIVEGVILRFQERRIKFLEERIEAVNK